MSENVASVWYESTIADLAHAQRLEDGSARMEIRLAPVSPKHFENGTVFSLTAADVDQMIGNFNKRGAPVSMTIGHWPPSERQKQPAAAWIEGLRRAVVSGQEYLLATIRFLAPTWKAIQEDLYKFLSMEFITSDTDPHGADIGMTLDGAALTNYPFFPLRFDQAKASGRTVLTLARLGARETQMDDQKQKVDPKAGVEVRLADGQHCIYNSAGERLSCYPTKAEADAALAKMSEPGKKDAGKSDETVTLSKAEHAKLVKDSADLEAMRSDKGEVATLTKQVNALMAQNAENEKRLKAGRVRSAVTTLMKDHKIAFRLGTHDIKTDDGALAFLASRPFGIESVEGLEKLLSDTAETSHLPRVSTGKETSAGRASDNGDGYDVSTKDGRSEAVQRRVQMLRKEFGSEELDAMLKGRRQTAEQYARQELAHEHPKAGFDKD